MEKAQVEEIIQDALKSGRLTQWEREFIRSVNEQMTFAQEEFKLSPKQVAVMRKIEDKIYAAG